MYKRQHEGEGQLEVLRVGRPLVYYMGQEEHPDDYQILIDRFIKSLNISKEDGLLLVGHGGLGSGNSSYGNLQFKLIRDGLTNVRVAVLENAPYVADVAMPWEWLDGKRPNTIHLHPLLLVLGDQDVYKRQIPHHVLLPLLVAMAIWTKI